MKSFKLFSFLSFLLFTSALANAQNGNGNNAGPNGNAVVSEVKVYDHNDGTGTIEVHVSGNLAYAITDGAIAISGNRILGTATLGTDQSRVGGGLSISPSSSNGSSIVVSGNFQMLPSPAGNGPDFVNVNIELHGRIGDYTISVVCPQFTIATHLSY